MEKSEAIRDILEGYGKGNWFSVDDGSVSLTWWENDGHEYVYIESGQIVQIGQLVEVVGEMEPRQAVSTTVDNTCHIEGPRVANTLEHDCPEFILNCDKCGYRFGYVNYGENGSVWTSEVPRYCPNCGRKVFQP